MKLLMTFLKACLFGLNTLLINATFLKKSLKNMQGIWRGKRKKHFKAKSIQTVCPDFVCISIKSKCFILTLHHSSGGHLCEGKIAEIFLYKTGEKNGCFAIHI